MVAQVQIVERRGLIRLPEGIACKRALTLSRAGLRRYVGQQVQVVVDNAAGLDTQIHILRDHGNKRATTFFYDAEVGLPYFIAKDSQASRLYIFNFKLDKSFGNIPVYHGGGLVGDLILIKAQGQQPLEIQNPDQIKTFGYLVYGKKGELTSIIAGENQGAPFKLGVTGFCGPFKLFSREKSYIFGGSEKYFYFLLERDMEKLSLSQGGEVWVELEKGWPITIYANQQKTGNQLYFRLVRDRNWNIIGSARQKIFGQKLKGLQIWEGVETSFVKKVHITNVKISVGAYFFVVSLPHDDARQIKQVSCVIHNGSIVLMLPAVKFDGYMRFIANLVMEACEKGTFSQEIREKAEDIYKAYVLEDMQKVQEEQFALLKLLGKPLRGQDDLMG